MLKTGDHGGQCVIYAGSYFGKKFGVQYAAQIWDVGTVTRLKEPQSGCCACWSGGAAGYGHVGVIESWDAKKKIMTFSDSNRKNDEKVVRNVDITEDTLKGFFGKSLKFQGYVKFK